jgi:hypothetical protein
MNHLNFIPYLFFHQGLELYELTEHFILSLQKINPSPMREIINESGITQTNCQRGGRDGYTYFVGRCNADLCGIVGMC